MRKFFSPDCRALSIYYRIICSNFPWQNDCSKEQAHTKIETFSQPPADPSIRPRTISPFTLLPHFFDWSDKRSSSLSPLTPPSRLPTLSWAPVPAGGRSSDEGEGYYWAIAYWIGREVLVSRTEERSRLQTPKVGSVTGVLGLLLLSAFCRNHKLLFIFMQK